MKVEVTLTSDEYAALATAPGRSAQQRLKWLVKFWQAVQEEHAARIIDAAPVVTMQDPASPYLTVPADIEPGRSMIIGDEVVRA